MTQRDTERHRETQRDTERHRKTRTEQKHLEDKERTLVSYYINIRSSNANYIIDDNLTKAKKWKQQLLST